MVYSKEYGCGGLDLVYVIEMYMFLMFWIFLVWICSIMNVGVVKFYYFFIYLNYLVLKWLKVEKNVRNLLRDVWLSFELIFRKCI